MPDDDEAIVTHRAPADLNPRTILTPAFGHLGNHLGIRAAALELAAPEEWSLIYGLYMSQLALTTVYH